MLIACLLLFMWVVALHIHIKNKEISLQKVTYERDVALNDMIEIKKQSDQYKIKIDAMNKISQEEARKGADEADKVMREEIPESCEGAVEWAKKQALNGI